MILSVSKDGYPYYFRFTLTGYRRDIEPGLPDKRKVLIPTFCRLAKQIGKERVIWPDDKTSHIF